MEVTSPITIVGCGPGSPDCLTPQAARAARDAEALVGANHLLELFSNIDAERIPVGADVPWVLDQIAGRHASKRVVVLVSGDPGLFSLAQSIIRRFGRENCCVIPGISSVHVAFARICLDWYDAKIISVHGREADIGPISLNSFDKIAVLTSGTESLEWISSLAAAMVEDYALFTCEDLTMEGERVRQVEWEELEASLSPRAPLC